MEPMKWTRTEAGRYVADNQLQTRRYVVQKIDKKWHLTVWNLRRIEFKTTGDLLLTDGDPVFRDCWDAKYEAVAHANMWEARRLDDMDAHRRFHNEMADRWIGPNLDAALTAELRERLYI